MPVEPFIGEIALYPYNFPPSGYAFCQGQLLSISQNTALFALLGTTYGGNGTTTFALPDLRGRVPLGSGQGTGLANYPLGQQGGAEVVTLTLGQVPAHNHALNGSADPGDSPNPNGAFLANSGALDKEYKGSLTNAVVMNVGAIGMSGNGQAHSNVQPYLVLNYCIALQGTFPSRD